MCVQAAAGLGIPFCSDDAAVPLSAEEIEFQCAVAQVLCDDSHTVRAAANNRADGQENGQQRAEGQQLAVLQELMNNLAQLERQSMNP